MRIAGVVVNYRTADLTARVVSALLKELEAFGEPCVLLVDNASGDGSVEALRESASREGWGDRVTLLAETHNGGYGYGINRAVQKGRELATPPDCYFVLNSDAFADPGAVQALVTFMQEHPDAGLCGGDIRDTARTSQAAAFRFPSATTELNDAAQTSLLKRLFRDPGTALPLPSEPTQVDWISGACMLIRAQVFADTGGFDEDFFLYFEEIDFCRRAALAGWRSYCVPSATITHLGSVSTGIRDRTHRLPRYWFNSRHRYFTKHYGRRYALACDAAWAAGFLISEAKRRALSRQEAFPEHMFGDLLASSVRLLLHGSSALTTSHDG